ncbi:periostin-like isoform X2 [Platichthys flesus]|uniref:periostin-like isoform X2 n=1 Tax=Platichthys flesus TaxID=8260 RepID=UPI002DBF28F7|nr:periostin-like isoform X2 [Platichthys flesus]
MHQLLAVTSALVALCCLGSVDSSAYDKIVTHSRIRARTEGPNVCALQQVLGTQKKYFSTCRNWYKRSICGKKATALYECCPGYMRLEGMKGCPAVAPIDHVYGTLGLVGATTTQQYADIAELRAEIEGQGSFTLFAPSNEAWDQLDPSVRSALVSNVNIELYNALHFHMVNRRLLTKGMKDGMTVNSMYNDLGLHINHYSNGVVTVNCARIIHGNQVATNGVVHVIDRVISAVGRTIKDVLDVEDDLSSFNAAALASGMMDKLDQPGQFTLFAPTNEAFDKLNPGYLERIMDNKAVIAALVNYHLLKTVQCSEAITAGSVYETEEGSNIEIGCDGDSLTVNGIKMVLKKDIVTTNGVIHLIDQVLIPDSAKDVFELMGDTQSVFTDMVSELGLASAMRPQTEYTLLAPVNGAFTNEVMSTDQNLLRYILENHILKLKVTLGELYNGQLLETLAGQLLRVFIYRTAVCIENACMVRGSKEGSNGAVHLMNSLIKPAKKTMYELLLADGRFKIFLSLMETADLTDLLKQEGSSTIFAPTDEAFAGLSAEDYALLRSDLNVLRTILLYHFSNGIFINGGLEGGVTNLLKTLQGNNLQVKSVNNSIHVNSVQVPSSDLMATNGVIHIVKNVLYPGDLPVGRQDLMVILQKLIRYITIKYVSGFTYTEIPLTSYKRTITTTHYTETVPDVTKVIRVMEAEPKVTKVTRVIEGDPEFTTLTRVIEKQPTVTEVVIRGDPVVTKVTRVIETDPNITKVVGEGEPSVTKLTRVIETGDPRVTKVTRVIGGGEFDADGKRIQGPDFSKITTIHGNPDMIDEESERITKLIREGGRGVPSRRPPGGEFDADRKRIQGGARHTTENEPHIIEGPDFSKITTIHGNPDMIDEESERITKLIREGGRGVPSRRPPGGEFDADRKRIQGGARHTTENEPHIIEGPDFSKITTIHGNPSMIREESERITKLIKEGGRGAPSRRPPAGMRRARLVRRHHKPRQ